MLNSNNKRYNNIIIDSVNLCYRTFKTDEEFPIQISQKTVFRNSVCNFIRVVEDLKATYLDLEKGQIYLLFDNYYSKMDMKSTFMFTDRKQLDEAYKANRTKESKSFYNSVNLLRYYYLLGDENYHTARIENLEADDLVKPLMMSRCKDQTNLFITTDLDWGRYLNVKTDWVPDFSKDPETIEDLSYRLGFPINETNLIAYKALFGDASDNIDKIITLNEKNKKQFIELLPRITYPEELILLSRDTFLQQQYPILLKFNDPAEDKHKKFSNEVQYSINVRLVSSIPCSVEHLASVLTSGRNATTLYHTVQEAIGLTESKQEFVFGNIKRPRGI